MAQKPLSILLVVTTVITTVSCALVVDPTSAVKEGFDILLTCTVVDNSTVLRWIHDTEHISENREITTGTETDNARYSITGDENLGEYNLQILDVRKAHAGTYTCSSGSEVVERRTLVVEDAVAPTSDPTCSMDTSVLQEGATVNLICQTIGGSPKVDLLWSSGGIDYVSTTTETDDEISITLTLELKPEYQGDVFTCTGLHPTYSGAKRCSLPPLNIQLLPRIVVTVIPPNLQIFEDKGGTFECSATGDPPVTSYYWQYQNQRVNNTDRRFRIDQNDHSLTIVSGEKNMDGAELKCVAQNKIDSRYALGTITIVAAPVDEGFSLTFIAAIGVLVLLIVIIVCCVIPITAYCCYRRHLKEKQRKKVLRQTQVTVINDKEGAGNPSIGVNYYVQNEDVHYKSHGKRSRSRSRRRRHKSRVIKHNVVSPNGDIGHKGGHGNDISHKERRTSDGYEQPVSIKKRKDSPPGEKRSRSESPTRNGAEKENGPTRSQSENRRPRRPDRVSLSPGEYFKRAELESQRFEMEALERSMTVPKERLSPRRKHRKKRSRDSKRKRDRSPVNENETEERTN